MVIVDIETSGLNPHKNSILEIGALDFFNPSNRFYQKCKIFEDEEVDRKSLEINGYDNNQLYDQNKQDLKNLLLNFIDWLKPINDKTLGGQNVDFDILFLNEAVIKYSIDWIFGWRKIDLHTLIYCNHLEKGINPPTKNELSNLNGDKIMEYVGLPAEPKPHSGINGALYEAEAFSRVIYGKLLINEFERYILPTYLTN